VTTSGNVNITIVDNGGSSILVPASSVQVVIGCSSAGTVNQIVATRSLTTLASTFGTGPLPEAAGLAILRGATVIAIRATSNTAGAAGTVVTTGTGTSVTTVTGAATDDYFVQFTVLTGGTIGTGPIIFTISLDAGRTTGPSISLGTANTYAIPGTGLTLHFAAGTLVAGDIVRFATTAPTWNDAGIAAALSALQASQYAISGWGGGTHIVGVAAGADATTFESGAPGFDQLAAGYLFTGFFCSARDAHAPTAWGGAGETEATWMAAIESDYSAVSAKRGLCCAGYYNMPSAFTNAVAGAPRYRRSLAWAQAARQVEIQAKTHSGRVKDGSLVQIVVDPTNDPSDGFIYHDERINVGLDVNLPGGAGRFCAAWTRPGYPGFFITNPTMLAPAGSDFFIWPLRAVMDLACTIVHQSAQLYIDDDVRVNKNGTIYENDAKTIEGSIYQALKDNLIATSQISAATVAVDRTNNILTTKTVNITITITSRGYVLQENVTISYANTSAAS